MARHRVAEATCTHCMSAIHQDTSGTWRHDSDGKVRCLPIPPGAAPIPKTIKAVRDA